jgi:hypothetical protein
MASPPISNLPVVLFPLKLETRFIGDELWIRAFPDTALLQSHEPRLTSRERADASRFKQTPADQKKEAWEDLVGKYGVYRGAWIVQISEQELTAQEQAASEQGERPEGEAASFRFNWLPDRLVFYLYRQGQRSPAYTVAGSLIDRGGLTVLGQGDAWVQDFSKAVEAGMAARIKIDAQDTAFERVIVSGIRYAEDPMVPARGLAQLFHNHQYTEGFSFLTFGVPTNNTETAKSGFSARDEFDAPGSYEFAVEGLELETADSDGGATAGKGLSASLGMEAAAVRHARQADLREPPLNALFQKATWFALGAEALFLLFGNAIDNETHLDLWHHYARYVRSRGPYAPLKIGNQPYGVLPVTEMHEALTETESDAPFHGGALLDRLWKLSAALMEQWLRMLKENPQSIPRVADGGDAYTEMLKILSMREGSSVHQIRALEYNDFRRRLYEWLRRLRNGGSIDALASTLDPGGVFRKDFDNVRKNRDSLLRLIPTDLQDGDRLLWSPLLSFSEADANLLGFHEGQTVVTDRFGAPLAGESGGPITEHPNAFSLTQDDLSDLQAFVDTLEPGQAGDLLTFQYRSGASLFTDLFYRSYANASQLYHRDVTPELRSEDLRNPSGLQGDLELSIGRLHKAEGETVANGETVLDIVGRRDNVEVKVIPVTAPFEGTIVKLRVSAGDRFALDAPLFTLIHEVKHREITAQFKELGQRLVDECSAIADPKARKEAQIEALRQALDLNSYRLDAWVTSLATRRIQETRSRPEYAGGLYFGAYGWVEDLARDTDVRIDKTTLTDIYTGEGGMIHAASAAQAVASAIFKNSFLSYNRPGSGNPFALNLTSDRLQKSQALLEGIRQGQELEALLGYQLERYLHEHPNGGGLHNEIHALREAFPLYENITGVGGQATGFVQLSVIDGLKAIQNKEAISGANKAAVLGYIGKLEDTLDASLDTLFYEAGYQVTQGNLSHAAAALDATKGEIEPPAIESLHTKIPGVGVSHKLILGLSPSTVAFPIENCRAFAEPVLEQWLRDHVGDLREIGCAVELIDTITGHRMDTVDLSLADLDIGYLDLMYLSKDPVGEGAGELELRIWKKAIDRRGPVGGSIQYRIIDPATSGRQPLSQAMEVIRSAYALLSRCRFLKSEDLSMEGEAARYDHGALDEIKTGRLGPILQQMKTIADTGLDADGSLAFLAKLDLEAVKTALLGGERVDTATLIRTLEQKIATVEAILADLDAQPSFYAAVDLLQQAARTLFGPDFLLLPTALGSDAFAEALQSPLQRLLVGDSSASDAHQVWGQERIEQWVQGLAQVRENTEVFEDWLMVQKAWQQVMELNTPHGYRIVQAPTLLRYPWLALSKKEIDTLLTSQYEGREIFRDTATGGVYPLSDDAYYPDGCDSTVICAANDFTLRDNGVVVPVCGLVIDEFAEHIPKSEIDTGLSFHYNAPNNEPPQAILLAVHPKAGMTQNFAWSEDDLRGILYDTMDLYKVRMIDTDALQWYGYVLPMAYCLNLPTTA